jgi:tRNA-binding EMAP/Myf-like protein
VIIHEYMELAIFDWDETLVDSRRDQCSKAVYCFQIPDYYICMTIDEFQKVELKVGRIVAAERVDGSEKLLRLQVDIGPMAQEATEGQSGGGAEHPEIRQILSGIAKTYAPEDLLQKEVVLVTNLDPREMMGMMSQGMILAAHGEAGEPVLLSPWKEVPPGSKIT